MTSGLPADARRILGAQALRAFGYGFGAVLLGVTLRQRGYSPGLVGAVLTAVVAGTVVASALLARYGDRTGRRRCYVLMYLLLPFLLAGVIKSGYDLTLWAWFRRVPVPAAPDPGPAPFVPATSRPADRT